MKSPPVMYWCPCCSFDTAVNKDALAHEAERGIDHRCQRWTSLELMDPVALRTLVAQA